MRSGTIAERCANGDASAWEALVQSHERRVFNVCYRFTNSNSDAQDLTQEVFLRVFRTVKTFRAGGGSFDASFEASFDKWMARLTRNLLIDNYRRRRQDRMTDELEPRLPKLKERLAGCWHPDGLLRSREIRESLDAKLRRLSPELREALVLREFEEMEYREIASALGVPEGTVKSRLNRARAELARGFPKSY